MQLIRFSSGLAGLIVCIAARAGQPAAEIAAPSVAPQSLTDVPAYFAQPGRLVDVGGYRLNYYCLGSGSPTVVLLSGGAWGAVAWSELQPALAKKRRVCSYDRAAMNFSDIGPLHPAVDQDYQELRVLLGRAAITPPYVLVGWSAGGMLARWYAFMNPDDVAALVTLDGSDFDYWDSPVAPAWLRRATQAIRECWDQAEGGVLAADVAALEHCLMIGNPRAAAPALRQALDQPLHDPALYERWLAGIELIAENARVLAKLRRNLGHIPMRVVVAGSHFHGPGQGVAQEQRDADQAFIQHSYEIAASSSDSELIVVPGTSHGVHLDRPEQVGRIINDLVERVVATDAGVVKPRQ